MSAVLLNLYHPDQDGPMRRIAPVHYLLFLGFLPAVARAQTPPRATLVQQVFAAESAFARTMATRDSQAFAGYVATDAVFSGKAVQHGRAAVAASWKPFF